MGFVSNEKKAKKKSTAERDLRKDSYDITEQIS